MGAIKVYDTFIALTLISTNHLLLDIICGQLFF